MKNSAIAKETVNVTIKHFGTENGDYYTITDDKNATS
jgi:hypothetical protein